MSYPLVFREANIILMGVDSFIRSNFYTFLQSDLMFNWEHQKMLTALGESEIFRGCFLINIV